MEDKVKRECKTYIEKQFKKYDTIGAAAIVRDDMRKLMENLITGFNQHLELDDKMDAHAKNQKYTSFNSKTKTLDVQYLQDSLDFPSTMAIAVSFLNKMERRNTDAFSGKGLITFADMPHITASDLSKREADGKRRLF